MPIGRTQPARGIRPLPVTVYAVVAATAAFFGSTSQLWGNTTPTFGKVS